MRIKRHVSQNMKRRSFNEAPSPVKNLLFQKKKKLTNYFLFINTVLKKIFDFGLRMKYNL